MPGGGVPVEVALGWPPGGQKTWDQSGQGSPEVLWVNVLASQGSVNARKVWLLGGNPVPSNGMCCAVRPIPPCSGTDGDLCLGCSSSGSSPPVLLGIFPTYFFPSTTACALRGSSRSCPQVLLRPWLPRSLCSTFGPLVLPSWC